MLNFTHILATQQVALSAPGRKTQINALNIPVVIGVDFLLIKQIPRG